MLSNLFFLTDDLSITLGEAATAAAEKAPKAAEAVTEAVSRTGAAAGTGIGIGGTIGMLIYIVGLVALFYFFGIRPQRKREKELKTMQDAVKTGDWVMTSSGFYGIVVDITDQVFIVEFGTNKSVRIPVKKSEIIGNKEPNLTNKPSEDDEDKK